MTNKECYEQLSNAEKANFRETYSRHPLFPYIDWTAFSKSGSGNTLDFVRCIDKHIDADPQKTFFILEEDDDKLLVFNCEDNEFIKIPYDFESKEPLVNYVGNILSTLGGSAKEAV